MNKYHIFIPSHNRATFCKSAEACLKEGLDFSIVVEPSQYESYLEYFPKRHITKLKYNGKGVAYKRNEIIKLSKQSGQYAHWQIDDKVGKFYKKDENNKIIPISIAKFVKAMEKEFDKYEDLAVFGPRITAFSKKCDNSFSYATFPYSCWLQRTDDMPKFRPETLDDVDYAMQLITRGECVMRSNVYIRETCTPGKVKGGNSVTSQATRDALNEKVAKVVEYFDHVLDLDMNKRKDGVWDVKPKKRLSLIFPQRPTLKKRAKA